MAKKSVKRKVKVAEPTGRSKIKLVLKNLVLFVALTLLFILFQDLTSDATLIAVFNFLFILSLMISIALVIAFLVLIVLKWWKG